MAHTTDYQQCLKFFTDSKEELCNESEDIVEFMHQLGYWCQERSPWTLEDPHYWCGFTPHGVTGFNGEPDFWTPAESREEARWQSAYKCIEFMSKAPGDADEC